jgi:hypothetical protein
VDEFFASCPEGVKYINDGRSPSLAATKTKALKGRNPFASQMCQVTFRTLRFKKRVKY